MPDLDYLHRMLANADSDSTDRRLYGIDSRCMTLETVISPQAEQTAVGSDGGTFETANRRPRAVLYARVSTDLQQKEGTIESQIATLRRQIRASGHELVKEYIDDGYTGTLLSRPGLDQLRTDLRGDVFDAIHFLAADRIARRAAYQSIIIEELIKAGKQIIINGTDYRNDPEGKVTLGILGVVSEFERAKIIERMMRGMLHRLRKGEMIGGQAPYGYEHVCKTAGRPATLAPKEPEATIVRTLFEKFDSGVSIVGLNRWLQANEIKTRFGKTLWHVVQLKNILQCRTYTGTRHFHPMNISDAVVPKHQRKPGKESSEVIRIQVPALVPQELFDRVQAKFAQTSRRYKQPPVHHLLRGMIECGECGSGFHSYRRYTGKNLASGARRLAHKAAYKCNWRVREKQHLLDRITRCHNPEVATHLLEAKVLEMLRETLFVPERLIACLERLECGKNDKHEHLVRKLKRFTDRIAGVEAEKEHSINRYAAGALTKEAYIALNLSLDAEIQRLRKSRARIAKELEEAAANDLVQESIREYCQRTNERLDKCTNFDMTRQFLVDHVQRITYLRDKVTLLGSVPVRRGTFQAPVPVQFRIEGELDRKAIRARPHNLQPDDGRWKKLNIDSRQVRPNTNNTVLSDLTSHALVTCDAVSLEDSEVDKSDTH